MHIGGRFLSSDLAFGYWRRNCDRTALTQKSACLPTFSHPPPPCVWLLASHPTSVFFFWPDRSWRRRTSYQIAGGCCHMSSSPRVSPESTHRHAGGETQTRRGPYMEEKVKQMPCGGVARCSSSWHRVCHLFRSHFHRGPDPRSPRAPCLNVVAPL